MRSSSLFVLILAPVAALTLSACASTGSAQPAGTAEEGAPHRGEVTPPTHSTAAPHMRPSWEATLLPSISDQEGTVMVSGVGRVEVEPDRAVVSFAVETEAGTALEASQGNARQMEAVMSAVRGSGAQLPGFRVETSGYSISPRYSGTRDGQPLIVGYTARNTVVVTVDEVTAVGGLMDTAIRAGANRMSGLHFLLQDAEPHRREALRRATEQARAEAEILAEALGLRLGAPLEVQGGAETPGPRPYGVFMADARAMEASVATPVEAGLQTVTAHVSIRFRLTP